MDLPDKNLLTPQQLCDILEVYLGRERGREECRRLIEKMKDDPDWRAQMDTLGTTVRVFQKAPCERPPEDVCYRLMQVLDLDDYNNDLDLKEKDSR
ncbi:MAG TPA: hypothetical protein ENH10_10260 [Bacteroidetes bacterium]|nr:hypothetical protein BMS3Bbin04_01436 [bacterium BMS3Bbin04]HDO66389.1 hypothetical protein [Bacteroidota bacterium]HEX05514.1 hypothetical protein [Bacteroidota bacterium]